MEEQQRIIAVYKSYCEQSINASTSMDNSGFCPEIWDGIFCWPRTPGGSIARVPCPDYLHGFNPRQMASRQCENKDNDTWWFNPERNQSWSNYTQCNYMQPSMHAVHVPVIKCISQTGYSISLTLLIIACLILGSIRRLRCPRNNLHLQLFASFILRAFVSLLRDLTQGDGSEHSVVCKVLTSVWQYCLMANYCWILMEGLYLHNLLFLFIFSDASGILKYGLAGWSVPVLFLIPWIILRVVFEDNFCWTLNENQLIFWIIRGPITASILLNLFFFLNISRVLFLKMFSDEAVQNRRYRYRKWFKSTLVLVPLFGVHYAFLLSFSFTTSENQTLEILWLYIDQTFTSFQGSFVAFLYCFLNGEVKAEVRKLLDRLREKEGGHNPQHSLITQSLTYLSKGRASVQSLHTVAERRENWKNGDTAAGDKQNWGEAVARQAQAESLL